MKADLQRLPHPGLLLVGSLVFLVSLLLAHRGDSVIYLFILFIAVAIGLRCSFGRIVRDISRLWPFLLFTWLFHLFLNGPNSDAFISDFKVNTLVLAWGPAFLFTGRLILILSIGILLFQLHPAQRYGRAFGRFLQRFGARHLVLSQTELVVTLALRLVPFLEQESRRLEFGLAARGIEGGTSLRQRLKTRTRLLYPLLLNAFRRADHVSLALEARGWRPAVRPTSLVDQKPRLTEWGITGLVTLGCVLAVLL